MEVVIITVINLSIGPQMRETWKHPKIYPNPTVLTGGKIRTETAQAAKPCL